jgi:uncharacterized flavoprotein (TIGR03862 family)
MPRKRVIIIGGGPAALIAADFLSNECDVEIYEKEKNVGQKFLVAGKGGFNLTNSLTGIDLTKKYTPTEFLHDAILNFDSTEVRDWLYDIGIKTFIGTSGRVFADKTHKPIEVLESIKQSLLKKNVRINSKHKFIGFDDDNLPIIKCDNTRILQSADYYIFALGGASWSITGSDGKWLDSFKAIGIKTKSFEPSNCGINIRWPKLFLTHHVGKPLKNIQVSVGEMKFRGEAVITEYGLEGNAIYQAIPKIRKDLRNGNAYISIDFKPNNTHDELLSKIKKGGAASKDYKKVLNLSSHELALLKAITSKENFLSPSIFCKNLKSLQIRIDSLRPIEEAISTIGGIDLQEINSDFSLNKHQKFYIIGEMADWDAPTGGFLLQGCFSMGMQAARSILSENN